MLATSSLRARGTLTWEFRTAVVICCMVRLDVGRHRFVRYACLLRVEVVSMLAAWNVTCMVRIATVPDVFVCCTFQVAFH